MLQEQLLKLSIKKSNSIVDTKLTNRLLNCICHSRKGNNNTNPDIETKVEEQKMIELTSTSEKTTN